MSIPRSKSAPQAIAELRTTSLPRTLSQNQIQLKNTKYVESSTKVQTPSLRSEKEDPFSLSSFFPASLLGFGSSAEWGWLRETNDDEERQMEDLLGYGDDTAQSTFTAAIFGQQGEEKMSETIKGEDKLGILSFETPHIFNGMEGEEVVDDERLYRVLVRERGEGLEKEMMR